VFSAEEFRDISSVLAVILSKSYDIALTDLSSLYEREIILFLFEFISSIGILSTIFIDESNEHSILPYTFNLL